MRSFRFQKHGFTILEVLTATLLVGFGIFAIMEAFNRGMFGSGDVEKHTLALSLTQEKMEEIKDLAFASVAGSARAALAGYTTFDQQVVVATPAGSPASADLKQITVTTFWQVPGGENQVSLTTYAVNG